MGGDVLAFFFDEERNVFIDEDGFPVWDIYDFITPNQCYLAIKEKRYMVCVREDGMIIELFFPDSGQDVDDVECLFDRR